MRSRVWCWVNFGHWYAAKYRTRIDDEFWSPWIDTCYFCAHERKVKKHA